MVHCRQENPNVVKVYDKYKGKGFHGIQRLPGWLDSRTSSRFGNEKQPGGTSCNQKQRWVEAISRTTSVGIPCQRPAQSGEIAPAATYGVRSIPHLPDRPGREYRCSEPQRTEQIERELQSYCNAQALGCGYG